MHKLLAGPLNMAANHRGSSNIAAVPRLLWDITASPVKHVSGVPGRRPAFHQLPMLLMHTVKDQTAVVLSIAACEKHPDKVLAGGDLSVMALDAVAHAGTQSAVCLGRCGWHL